MSVITKENQLLKGGEFLIKESQFVDMFIPEDFNEDGLVSTTDFLRILARYGYTCN